MVKGIQKELPAVWGYVAIILQLVAYLQVLPHGVTTLDTIAIVLFIVIFYFKPKTKVLSCKWVVRLGGISTEIFLLHYPIVVYGAPFLINALPMNIICMLLEQIGLIAVSLIVAYGYHHWFAKLKFMKKWNERLEKIFDFGYGE